MKKVSIIVVLLATVIVSQAQTFICTDMNYVGKELDPQVVRKEKEQFLGSEAMLTIYDHSLRLSYKADGKTKSYIYDKVKDNEYQRIDKIGNGKTRKRVIKLHKIIAYIKSFSFESYYDNEFQGKVVFKRK